MLRTKGVQNMKTGLSVSVIGCTQRKIGYLNTPGSVFIVKLVFIALCLNDF